jgi:peroxiredoxin family protein
MPENKKKLIQYLKNFKEQEDQKIMACKLAIPLQELTILRLR